MSIAYKIKTDKVITVTSHTGGTGPKGDAATIQVGSVVSGQTASITNVGTETDAVFDFVLPKGDKGDPGRDGTNGRDGRDGQDGTAATIQVGRTETVTPGTPASVINEGTESAARLVFHIPQGVQGEQGIQGETGPAGRDGQDGAPGQGVPTGGTAGQILSKIDGTDYNTQWINAPSGGNPDFFKETGSKLIYNLFSDNSGTKTLTVGFRWLTGSSEPSPFAQKLDWGDGTQSDIPTTTTASSLSHTYDEYGIYTLTIYGLAAGYFRNYVNITSISHGQSYGKGLLAGIPSNYCISWNLPYTLIDTSTYLGTDFTAWTQYNSNTSGNLKRVLKEAPYFHEGLKHALILPQASRFSTCLSNAVGQDLEYIEFPPCTESISSFFPWNGDTYLPALKKIVVRAITPPAYSGTYAPPTNAYFVVPWSPDHSILAAYQAASGWSTYASRIYEEGQSV